MIYYATINENGEYTGFYTKEFHGDKIPTPNVQLNEEQWTQAYTIVKEGKWKWINGEHTFVPYSQIFLDEIQEGKLRAQRNDLLKLSDWTQIPNNPLTPQKQAEWAEYRQNLRDMFNQKPYIFPTEPNK
jgi:hypothetical protein